MRLFRPEALRGQDTLHGDVILTPPVGWQVLGVFLLVSVVIAGVFLSLASYARVTVLRGAVAVDRGLVRLAAARVGTYDELKVREGDEVNAGDLLAHVTVGASERGGSLQARRAEALTAQLAELDRRLDSLRRETAERVASLQAQIAGERRQLLGVDEQIALQGPLIRAAEDDLADVRPLQQSGLLSNRDLRLREEQVALRRQTLLRLQQDGVARRATIRVAEADIARVGANLAGEESRIASARAELDRAAAGEDVLGGVDLRAPVAGSVTAVLAHLGEAAGPGVTALTLVPRDSRTEAVFPAPASSAGLVGPGQPVRVAVDAYPFQTFGALEARVTSVSRATATVGGGPETFQVRTTLPATIRAYGQPQPLRPGMSLSARIRTHPRSLLAWLFDPILAVAKR